MDRSEFSTKIVWLIDDDAAARGPYDAVIQLFPSQLKFLFSRLKFRPGISHFRRMHEERFAVDVRARYGSALQPFIDGGHVIDDGARLRLSREGMLVANEIMVIFV